MRTCNLAVQENSSSLGRAFKLKLPSTTYKQHDCSVNYLKERIVNRFS